MPKKLCLLNSTNLDKDREYMYYNIIHHYDTKLLETVTSTDQCQPLRTLIKYKHTDIKLQQPVIIPNFISFKLNNY